MRQRCIDCAYYLERGFYSVGIPGERCTNFCMTIINNYKPVFIKKSEAYKYNKCKYFGRSITKMNYRGGIVY